MLVFAQSRAHSKGFTQQCIEPLESRCLLDGTTESVAVGNILFTSVVSDVPTGGTDLFRSNLDGSNQTLIKHWYTNTGGPHDLFGFHGQLFFGATDAERWSRQFVWKSDGTTAGTVPVGQSPYSLWGSYPHSFMNVNDRLLYFAQDTSHFDSIFTTDGTTVTQLLNPPYTTNAYYTSALHHVHVTDKLLYAETFNHPADQLERWQTDGTLAGTRIADPFGLIQDGTLRIFGSTGRDTIRLDSAGSSTKLTINGKRQKSSSSAFTGILISGLQGNDSILLDKHGTTPATINSSAGNDTVRSGAGDDEIELGDGNDVVDAGAGNDSIDAGWGSNKVDGGAGDDSIIAAVPGSGAGHYAINIVHGGAGNDSINGDGLVYGDAGNDTIDGNAADDFIDGGLGDDSLDGGYGNDTVLGGAGDDNIVGGWVWFEEDSDSLVGGPGADSLYGNFGDDTLVGGLGADLLDAGTGVDSVVSDATDTVVDAPAVALIYNVLCLSGTNANDSIQVIGSGTTLTAIINGQATSLAGWSYHFLRIDGGRGADNLSIETGPNASIYIFGGPGNDAIASAARGADLYGGSGNDTILGGDGGSEIDGGPGNDSLVGGSSSDTLKYGNRSVDLFTTDPAEMKIHTSAGEVDRYDGFEYLVCGSGNDRIVVDNPLDELATIYGGAGNDRLTLRTRNPDPSRAFRPAVSGDDGDDVITISIYNNPGSGYANYYGGDGNDRFIVENTPTPRHFGSDLGIDTVDYSAVTFVSGISVTLDYEDSNDGPFGQDDVDRDIDAVIGTAGDDTLVGGYGDNTLIGGPGNDSLAGGYGDDSLSGGPGDDTLDGGYGVDTLEGGHGNNVLIDPDQLVPGSSKKLVEVIGLAEADPLAPMFGLG